MYLEVACRQIAVQKALKERHREHRDWKHFLFLKSQETFSVFHHALDEILRGQLPDVPAVCWKDTTMRFQDHMKHICDSVGQMTDLEIQRAKAGYSSLGVQWWMTLHQTKGLALGMLYMLGSLDRKDKSTTKNTIRLVRAVAESSFYQIVQAQNYLKKLHQIFREAANRVWVTSATFIASKFNPVYKLPIG
jgi:hypothetical protein